MCRVERGIVMKGNSYKRVNGEKVSHRRGFFNTSEERYRKFTLQTQNMDGNEHNYILYAENKESAMENALRLKQNVSGILSILALK